jgi:chorismate mutase/prephenate dehydratase
MSDRQAAAQIPELRGRIDEIDSEILRLLNRRAQLVLDVGRLKAEQNLDFHVPLRDV